MDTNNIMKKTVVIPAVLLITLLCSCDKDRHYYVKIVNNSDKTVVVTGSRAGRTIIGSLEPDVTFSWVPQNGAPPIEPHSELILDLSPVYFEMFNENIDRCRFYFIEESVFDTAGGNLKQLNPGDYLGYIGSADKLSNY